jgi:hypothetical protein
LVASGNTSYDQDVRLHDSYHELNNCKYRFVQAWQLLLTLTETADNYGEMREIRIVYRVSVGKSEERNHFEDTGINRRILLWVHAIQSLIVCSCELRVPYKA